MEAHLSPGRSDGRRSSELHLPLGLGLANTRVLGAHRSRGKRQASDNLHVSYVSEGRLRGSSGVAWMSQVVGSWHGSLAFVAKVIELTATFKLSVLQTAGRNGRPFAVPVSHTHISTYSSERI